MDKKQIIESTIKQLLAKGIIKNPQYELVSDANNLVVRVDGNYLKIYQEGKTTVQDNELQLYKKLNRPDLFKKVLADGIVPSTASGLQYALYETIHGKPLDEVKYTPQDAKGISKSVYDFIQTTAEIPCEGFGTIDQNFNGSHETFKEFMFHFQHRTSTTLYMNPSTRKYSALGYNLLVKFEKLLNFDKPSIIPVDLNMKNFLITDDGKTKVPDPGALLAGPKEMAYGEFTAHAFGTPLYEEFKKHIGDADERLVRLFATLGLSNVLAFIVKHTDQNPETVKPFGNPNTFFSLIDEHKEFLQNNGVQSKVFSPCVGKKKDSTINVEGDS